MGAAKQLKPKSCRVCKDTFTPFNSLTVVCSVACSMKLAEKKAEAKVKKAKKLERREFSKARKAHKESDVKWMKEQAQVHFNAWIRLVRDDGMPCQSCGKALPKGRSKDKEAGHYKSRGAHSSLRYDEHNVLLECHRCNHHSDNHLIGLRESLAKRFGEDEAERLDNAYAIKKWTLEEVTAIRNDYRERCRVAGVNKK